MAGYRAGEDVRLVQELLGLSLERLAEQCGVTRVTLSRWIAGKAVPSSGLLDAFYDYAYSRGVRLSKIKAQLYREDCDSARSTVLFHGSKEGLEGAPSLAHGRDSCDFGRGFYCGESFEQAAMFVSSYPRSCVYACSFQTSGLRTECFSIERDWMLAVALFRGKLDAYLGHPTLRAIRDRVERADCVVAPIADNRMFEIIDSFADGELTDVQCSHCLSATDLGSQYVLRTNRAIEGLEILERCHLCPLERAAYLEERSESTRVGRDKSKVARRQYRNEGLYVEELLS